MHTEPASLVVLSMAATRHLKRRTVPSIYRTVRDTDTEVIVVHNGFDDFTTLGDDRTKLIRSQRPLHVAHGYNMGIRACKNEIIVIVHDDVEFREVGWLDTCIRELRRPGIGAVGAVLHEIGGPMYFKGMRIPFLQCAPLVTFKQILVKVGLFDETFFQGLEDVDWNYRLFEAGYSLAIVPFNVVHRQGLSTRRLFGKGFPLHFYWHALSQGYFRHFFSKHRGLLGDVLVPPDLFDDGIASLVHREECLSEYLRALSLLFARDPQAIPIVNRLVRQIPSNPRIKMLGVLSAILFNSYNEAQAALNSFRDYLEDWCASMERELLRKIADHYVVSPWSMLAWAHFHIGRVMYMTGSHHAAVESFTNATRQETCFPTWLVPASLLYSGMSALNRGFNSEATDLFQRVMQRHKAGPFHRVAYDLAHGRATDDGQLHQVETACLFIN